MPYTIEDWVREHALVCVVLPNEQGEYFNAVVPVAAITGEPSSTRPEWYSYRTSVGREANDFKTWQREHEYGTREG